MGVNPTRTISINNLDQLRAELDALQRGDASTGDAGVLNLLKMLNEGGQYTNADGKPVTFNSLRDWDTAIRSGHLYYQAGPGSPRQPATAEGRQGPLNMIAGVLNGLHNRSLQESVAALTAMKELLDSGDIMGAVFLLQTTRVEALDKQLEGRINQMYARNATIKTLNDDVAELQKSLAGKTGKDKADIEAKITTKQGEINQLNQDSQLEMIKINDLVSKRNQAWEMLSNIMNKIAKMMDTLIGNFR